MREGLRTTNLMGKEKKKDNYMSSKAHMLMGRKKREYLSGKRITVKWYILESLLIMVYFTEKVTILLSRRTKARERSLQR